MSNHLKDLFAPCKHSLERLEYHPEKYLGRHIALVALKAWLFTGDVNLVMAALFHDVAKPWSGAMNNGYWSNPDHPKQAAELVRLDDEVRYFIHQHGGDWEVVARICERHMAVKEGIPKKDKSCPYLPMFVQLDDMVSRYELSRKDFYCPPAYCRGELIFVGMSPLEIMRDLKTFTITVDRAIENFFFDEIPAFFHGTKFHDVGTILNTLV